MTLALVLAGKLLDLPHEKKTEILTRAVAGGYSEEGKGFAQLELASHLLAGEQGPDALRIVDSVVSGCRDKTYAREELAAALSLRAQITQEEKDFAAAKKEMEALEDPEHEQRLAIMLIEHGDLDEAEHVLSEAVRAGEQWLSCLLLRLDCGPVGSMLHTRCC